MSRTTRRRIAPGSATARARRQFRRRAPRRRPPTAITPALVAAAKKEGKVVWYTSVDSVPRRWPRRSRPDPGSRCASSAPAPSASSSASARRREQRSTPSTWQRSDAAHFIVWKREGLLPLRARGRASTIRRAPTRTAYAGWRIFCGHRLQHPAGEGRGRAEELCRPARSQWAGKIVKAHPGYSGTIMTATFSRWRGT